MSNCLDVAGYTKAYDTLIAVEDLSFHVRGGQILGLVGPNGAGKTTTMKAIAGIIPPTRGEMRVEGHDVIREPVAAKRRLAYVPDDPHLFESLTVWEHLRFVAAAYDVSNWQPLATALLDRFELTPKRDALAQELSRGMRQKLALCCASLHEPALLMLDEPMTGLDPHGIRTLKLAIREQAAKGTGVVISSHLLALVEDLVTDLLILHRGRLVFFGSLAEARDRFSGEDTSLEEVFFRATAQAAPPGPPPAPAPTSSQPPASA